MKYGFIQKLMWAGYKGTFQKTTYRDFAGRKSERGNEVRA